MRWMAFCAGGLPWTRSVISFFVTSDTAEWWWIGRSCDESAILRGGKAKDVTVTSTRNSLDALEILEDLCILFFQRKELQTIIYYKPNSSVVFFIYRDC